MSVIIEWDSAVYGEIETLPNPQGPGELDRLKFDRHEVVSRSLIGWMLSSKPEEFMQKGKDVVASVPDIPRRSTCARKSP
jgi:hypothetical protein